MRKPGTVWHIVKTRKAYFIVYILFHLSLVVLATEVQNCNRHGLVVIEFEYDSEGNQYQSIFKYHFENGALTSRERLSRIPTGPARFDLCENRLLKNRFIISSFADIFDLKKKKLIHIGDHERVLGVDNGRIIIVKGFYCVEHQRGKQRTDNLFFEFNLTDCTHQSVKNPGKWILPGLQSPQGTESVSVSNLGDCTIWLHDLKGNKKKLGCFLVWTSMECSDFPKPPVIWIDNTHIMTQSGNGNLVLVGINGSIEELVNIEEVKLLYKNNESVSKEKYFLRGGPLSNPDLYRDPTGNIIYEIGTEAFIIDTQRKEYRRMTWIENGCGFDYSWNRSQNFGHIFRFDKTEIGRWWASTSKNFTTDGYIAIEYGEVGSNLGYPKGIKVWSAVNKKWTTIDVTFLSTIVGWVNE